MRFETIRKARDAVASSRQPLPTGVIDEQVALANFRVRRTEPLKRRLIDGVGPVALAALQDRNRRRVGVELNPWIDDVAIGYRFTGGALRSALAQARCPASIERALVQGAHVGDDAVQRWLRLGVKQVAGVELFDMGDAWRKTSAILSGAFAAEVEFKQGSVDRLPYPDGCFDAVSSTAVYEHVGNLELAAQETARVLRPGGVVSHEIGPLYYSFGGDHCISAYGEDAGFDHLLLDDQTYQDKVTDEVFFARQPDPYCNFWAAKGIFSYALVGDYVAAFEKYFRKQRVVAVVSPEALAYRIRQPEKWQALCAKVPAEELLVAALCVVLVKP